MATATQPPPAETRAIQQRKPESLQTLLDKMKGQIGMALPKHMTAERMMRVALTAVQKSPRLKQCSPISIVGCVVQASQLGLEPDGVLGQCYMVPYNNYKTKQLEAQLQIGYRGFITLARRSGEVSNVYPELVYECDIFRVQLGTDKRLIHEPNYDEPTRGEVDPDTGELIGLRGAYAVVKYKDAAIDFEYMPIIELNRIRASSKSIDRADSPWNTAPAEMYRKCPIRKLAKRLPLSPELMKAAAHDEHVDAGVAVSTAMELVDLDEPIFQDTQDYGVSEKGAQSLQEIKAKFQNPQQPLQQENLDAEPPPESQSVAQQAQQAQQKVEAKRAATTTTTNSGKRLRGNASGSIEDEGTF
jgi:recombination protein RecT